MLKPILLAVLLSGQAYAQQKPVIGSFRDFSGGINTHQAATIIADNESPDLMNVSIDEVPGALVQRNGYLSCGSIPGGGTATNLYEYAKNNGSRQLIVTDNSSIWQTGDCIVYSTITTGQSAIAMPRFATIRDNLWIVNGTTWPIVWDGTNIVSRLDGVGDNPAGYQAKYIVYWKSRVFLANTPTAPSSVYFTSLTDDAGNELNPATSTSAWSALNQIYINRDDGSGITALKVYRDNLLVGKPDSWSRIVFESEYDLAVAKNATNIGTKFNESVIEMDDGLLRFAGRDGVYAFDGITPKRLSTKWTSIYESMLQPQIAEQYKLWDTAAEWIAGSPDINISTSVAPGSISLGYEDFADLNYTKNPAWTKNPLLSGTPSADNGYLEGDSAGVIINHTEKTHWKWKVYKSSYNTTDATRVIMNHNILVSNRNYSVYRSSITHVLRNNLTATNICSLTAPNILNNTWYQVQVDRTDAGAFTLTVGTITCGGNDTTYSSSTWTSFIMSAGARVDDIEDVSKSTGIFTSEIATATSITAWQNFSTVDTLNGQTITYEVRTATSVYNMATAVYKAIAPGAIVSTTTDGFAQWRASFATTDNSVTPTLDSASIGWLTGGAAKATIYGINYKSRYWLSAATTTGNNYNDLMMVESKNPLYTYTRHDLPVSAMTLWNGNLYGSISNTGIIARLDYGSTDNGSAINSYWMSKDFTGDNPIFYKTINRVILDYANSPANTGLVVSLSPDEGATWQDRTVNLSASALSRNTAKLNYTANTALGFRTKVSNSVLGLGFKIYGLHPIGSFSEFYGN